ncbi:AAA family ATPase [Sorangium sp. So ce1151]|uniref:AAA family ATPase n=1 Tax=Sorangium sp. So ce1151 TaxID=3133332 RepID=UPI003F5EC581
MRWICLLACEIVAADAWRCRVAERSSVARPAGPVAASSGISAIAVEGFKSIRKRTEIAVRPLTLLAGTNSSGKSSIVQPLLLMKQTLEALYDPGALLLDGPHVRFTAVEQLFSRFDGPSVNRFSVSIHQPTGIVDVRFQKRPKGGLDVVEMTATGPHGTILRFRPGIVRKDEEGYVVSVVRQRCFLRYQVSKRTGETLSALETNDRSPYVSRAVQSVRDDLRAIIHIAALRGNPERTYRTTAVGSEFSGTFEPYVASIIHHWQATKDIRLKQLGAALEKLGLNWTIKASRVDDTRVELRVGRLKQRARGRALDLVSIADVGFGVSQCLPVLVALLTARPGQLVYIEEPEIHLHPRAQVALAQILADAAIRGVRVVIETHSSLLLLGVQALVAEGALRPELVALHWFSLTKDGATQVRSADLDEAGAFGDWPEDFAEVALDAQARYLDAAERRMAKVKR